MRETRGVQINAARSRDELSIMRERADAVGAVLSIESRPGQGADLAMRWAPAPKQEVA